MENSKLFSVIEAQQRIIYEAQQVIKICLSEINIRQESVNELICLDDPEITDDEIENEITTPHAVSKDDVLKAISDNTKLSDRTKNKYKLNARRIYDDMSKGKLVHPNEVEHFLEEIDKARNYKDETKPLAVSGKISLLSTFNFIQNKFYTTNEKEIEVVSCKIKNMNSEKNADKKSNDKNTIKELPDDANLDIARRIMQHVATKINNSDPQLVVIAYLYTYIGVFRTDEFLDMQILEHNIDEKRNYINVIDNKIYIKKHKNMKRDGDRVIDISDHKQLLEMLIPLIGSNMNSKCYKGSDGFNRYLTIELGDIYNNPNETPYFKFKNVSGISPGVFRKANSSIAIKQKNLTVFYNQGHKYETAVDHYQKWI